MDRNGKVLFRADCDVNISFEDQMKLNKFNRHNTNIEEFKGILHVKENELRTLKEAVDELALLSDDAEVPYLVGEVFVCRSLQDAQANLNEEIAQKERQVTELIKKCDDLRREMCELKAYLYARFGKHINLENNPF